MNDELAAYFKTLETGICVMYLSCPYIIIYNHVRICVYTFLKLSTAYIYIFRNIWHTFVSRWSFSYLLSFRVVLSVSHFFCCCCFILFFFFSFFLAWKWGGRNSCNDRPLYFLRTGRNNNWNNLWRFVYLPISIQLFHTDTAVKE